MGKRNKTDANLVQKRTENDLKVIKYLVENIDELAKGRLESPQKLMVFYAGYTAMRSLWEAKTRKGKVSTGDTTFDDELKREPGKFIFRVDMEVSHSIGEHTKTLLRVTTFKYWGKKFLRLWGSGVSRPYFLGRCVTGVYHSAQ